MPDIKHFDADATLDTVMRLFWQRGLASTGIQDVVTATGLNRSSLYATFGGKQDLYLAALRRYVDQRSRPVLRRLADDERGLPAIADFFTGLIETRCSGEYDGWGCMVSNAHAGAENSASEVRAILEGHHQELKHAMRAALRAGESRQQLAPGTDLEAAADALALLAYGVNLRSRAGAEPRSLTRTVSTVLDSIGTRDAGCPTSG